MSSRLQPMTSHPASTASPSLVLSRATTTSITGSRPNSVSSGSTTTTRLKGAKVTEANFGGKALQLATSSKNVVRHTLAMRHAFPHDRETFLWTAINQASRNPDMSDVLQLAQQDQTLKANLVVFVRALNIIPSDVLLTTQQAGYAIGGLRSDLKSKAKNLVPGYYGISGKMSPQEVKDRVAWLCEKSRFTCGELDMEVRKPNYSHTLLFHLINGLAPDL